MDEVLQQLVAQAKAAPVGSSQRRIALSKLMNMVRRSDNIARQRNWSSIPNFQDIYDEALNETMMEICQKIDNYKPPSPVMAWINNTFNFRFIDIKEKYEKKGVTYLPRRAKLNCIELDREVRFADSGNAQSQLENIAQPESGDSELRLLVNFVTDDPDRVFATAHIKHLPSATFQRILLMTCEGKSWQEIADLLATSVPTASSFYQRNLRNYLPYLQNHLQGQVPPAITSDP